MRKVYVTGVLGCDLNADERKKLLDAGLEAYVNAEEPYDYVLRLPGASAEADAAVEVALKAGLSVFGTIEALIEFDQYGREVAPEEIFGDCP